MKRTIAFILLSMVIFIGSATMEAKTYKYVGTIGPYDVSVTLTETYFELSPAAGAHVTGIKGSYTYTKAGNTLRLEGESGYGNLGGTWLEEYTPKGKRSGTWWLDDYFLGDKIMKGTFTNLSNGKKFPIILRLKK